jgi:hypothetical protein
MNPTKPGSVLSAHSSMLQQYHGESKFHSMRWWWSLLFTRTTFSWIFIVLAHWNISLWVNMSLHLDTTRTPLKTRGEHGCSGRVSSSCSTSVLYLRFFCLGSSTGLVRQITIELVFVAYLEFTKLLMMLLFKMTVIL